MADVFSERKRSEVMSRIRSKDTEPEKLVRKALHGLGYRYRLHDKSLPGKPDLKLAKFKAVIQINGCFWHGHGCHLFKMPRSSKEYWTQKIANNKKRDELNRQKLLEENWRVLEVWECALKGKKRLDMEKLFNKIENWLLSCNQFKSIEGKTK